jgi:hypothetical protein
VILTHLTYTGLCRGLEHLKIETRLINERLESVMGEYDLEPIGSSSLQESLFSTEYTKVRTEDGDVTLETSLLWIDKSRVKEKTNI